MKKFKKIRKNKINFVAVSVICPSKLFKLKIYLLPNFILTKKRRQINKAFNIRFSDIYYTTERMHLFNIRIK